MKRSHTDRDAVLIKVMMTMMTRQKTKMKLKNKEKTFDNNLS